MIVVKSQTGIYGPFKDGNEAVLFVQAVRKNLVGPLEIVAVEAVDQWMSDLMDDLSRPKSPARGTLRDFQKGAWK